MVSVSLQALSIFGDAAVCNFPADEQVEVEGIGADGNTVKVSEDGTVGVRVLYLFVLYHVVSLGVRCVL